MLNVSISLDIPRIRGEESFSIQQQLLKLREEVDEAIQAPAETIVEELGDIIHAVEVLKRIMRRDSMNPTRALEIVIEKNRRRGYYDENDSN